MKIKDKINGILAIPINKKQNVELIIADALDKHEEAIKILANELQSFREAVEKTDTKNVDQLTFDFAEAMSRLKKGAKVRRKSWGNPDWCLENFKGEIRAKDLANEDEIQELGLSIEDVEASDWHEI